MPIRTTSTKSQQAVVWIPPDTTPKYKLTITDSQGTVYDVTNNVSMLKVRDGVTEYIGDFEFELYNNDESWTGKFTGNETVLYYKDYSDTATTLRFRGRVEKVSYRNYKIRVTGRSESLRIVERTVTKSYTDAEVSDILKDLISNYASIFTVTNVLNTGMTYTVSWFEKPFWDCVQELCGESGFSFYVDANMDSHFFEKGTNQNTSEAVVHTYNLLDVGDFAQDVSLVKNKVRVYGATINGVQVFYTAQDTTSQTTNITRVEIVKDDNITDYRSAALIGEAKLRAMKEPPVVGDVTAFLLAEINPGDTIRISAPYDNLPFEWYDTTGYEDVIDHEGGKFETSVKINKEPRTLANLFVGLLSREASKQDTSSNPFDMDYTYTFQYDTDEGDHFHTQITTGVLKLSTGYSSGTWTSPTRSADNPITQVNVIAVGQTMTAVSVEVSSDNGNTWTVSPINTLTTLSNPNQTLLVKVNITDTSTQIDSLSVQYR